ncbi:MAG: hypothetical protein Q7S79_03965 [bacterium]|nr:hypothetical protein [bacterium]
MKRLLSLLLIFQILLSSVLPTLAYAALSSDDGSGGYSEEQAPEPIQEEAPAPEPEPEPEQADAPQSEEPAQQEPAYEEYVEEAPPAETAEPGVPQEETLVPAEPTEEPTVYIQPEAEPGQEAICSWSFLRNECTGCGLARSIEQDCTGNTRISAENVFDGACETADYCQEEIDAATQLEREAQETAESAPPEPTEGQTIADYLDQVLENPITDIATQGQTIEQYLDTAQAVAESEAPVQQDTREDQEDIGFVEQIATAVEVTPDTFVQVAGAFFTRTAQVGEDAQDAISQVGENAYSNQLVKSSQEYEEEVAAAEVARQREIEAALSSETNTTQIAQSLDLPPDATDEQVVSALNNQLQNSGVRIEGTLDDFTITATDSQLPDAETLKNLPPDERRALLQKAQSLALPVGEFALDMATQGGYLWGKEQEARDSANKKDIDDLDKLRAGTGFSPPYGIVDPNQESEFFRLQRLTQGEIDAENRRLQEYDNLYQSVEAQTFQKRVEYAKAIAQYDVNQMRRIDDTMQSATAFVALNLVGGPIFDEGLRLIGKVAPAVGQAKSFIGDLFDRASGIPSAIKSVLKKSEPVVVPPVRPEFGVNIRPGNEPLKSLESLSLEELDTVEELWGRTFGRGGAVRPDLATTQKQVLAEWIGKGTDGNEIHTAVDKARRAVDDYIGTGGYLNAASQETKDVWSTMTYDSRMLSSQETAAWVVELTDSVLKQKSGQRAVKEGLEKSIDVLNDLRNYAVENGADTTKFTPIYKVVEPAQVHVVSNAKMQEFSKGANGLFFPHNQNILIREGSSVVSVIAHECIHKACALGNPSYKNIAPDIGGGDNMTKLLEGLTEWTTQKGLELAKMKQGGETYGGQVEAVKKIASQIQNNTSKERAEAIVIEAAMTGNYESLLAPLGNGDATRGKEILTEILNKTPKTTSNIYEYKVAAKQLSVALSIEAALGGGAYYGITQTETGRNVTLQVYDKLFPLNAGDLEPTPTPISRDFKFIKEVNAQESVNNSLIYSDDEYQAKISLAKNALKTYGKIDKEHAKSIVNTDVLFPWAMQNGDDYSFVTGSSGQTSGVIEKGDYSISSTAIDDVQVSIPESIEIRNGSYVIPIGIKEGKSEVKRSGNIRDSSTAVYAQDSNNSNKATVVTYHDENGNGKWDKNEAPVPWAGVDVELKKINQKNLVRLNNGWNLVSLTAVPSSPMTASTLIKEIAKQGGYATTISTLVDGVWKSYVVRGDNDFSGEDFAIEPGKAYFVKSLKKSLLVFEGQDFVTPVNIVLEDGWNAIGTPKTSQEYTINTLVDKLNENGAGADTASRWESGLWDSFVKKNQEKYGEDFPIENNRGYIIKVNKETQFVP